MRKILPLLGLAALLCACDPQYNWREIHGKEAPFSVLLPAKPATLARPIKLGEQEVTMNMTGAQVGHVSFAVGSVLLADPAQANAAVKLMQTALVNNINGKSKPMSAGGNTGPVELEASGTPAEGTSYLLLARFATSGNRAYQVIVLGPEKEVNREEAATFLSSFKPN